MTGFNYNHALNIGVQRYMHIFDMPSSDDGDSWFCFMNNDVICSKDWLVELDKAVREHPEMDSMCPNIRERGEGVRFGYATWVHLDGCCIFLQEQGPEEDLAVRRTVQVLFPGRRLLRTARPA